MTNDDFIGKLMAAVSRMEDTGSRMEGELNGLRQTVSSLQSTVATQTSQIATLNNTNQTLATEVLQLRAIVVRIPCRGRGSNGESGPDGEETNPECLQSFRPKLCSISEDEPDSVVTRQMELRASRSGIEAKGPSIMIIAFGAVVAAGLAAWEWVKSLPHGVIGIH